MPVVGGKGRKCLDNMTVFSQENVEEFYDIGDELGRSVVEKTFSSPPPPAYNRESPWWWSLPVVEPEQWRRRRKRGSRAGVLVQLRKRENRPPLPSILLANVQSLDNASWMNSGAGWRFNGTLRTVMFWFSRKLGSTSSIPDSAIVPEGLSIHPQDRTIHSGKSKGGGVCFMVNNKWCSDVEIISTGCSPGPGAPHDQMPALLSSAKSDHASVLLLPSYRQKLKRDGPVTRTIQQWSNQSDFGSARLLQHDGVKPWVNGEVRAKLKARTGAYNSGDLEEYRKSRYALRRAISSAKRQYRDKVESHYKGSNTRSMWAGLKTLTDYKKKISSAEVMSASLPDELNTFYARFESTSPAVEVQKAQEDHCPPVISRADVCRTLKRINTRKAPGPDGIPGRALKETTIVPVPKKTKILSLNDYRPVALTSTIMKCFERLVKSFITSSIPDSLDPLQFAYRPNRSTEDAIALTLHTALSHLDQRDTYVRMLFIDYSSAFNTIVPSKLVTKLRDLGLNSALCDWILNFLTAADPRLCGWAAPHPPP
ncbi:hypothetical protein L3Q82_023030 [Scortum barcoo]|uniref:Uncharacterized protein n=1 Tax=Scortum barcoo TaxID=214431 RepID=A0ACB8WXP7_9TELE|nr:hypothetical protein L3Q82_023030 [Scortum barcoo]